MRKIIFALVLIACLGSGSIAPPQPTAPANSIELTTNIGSLASTTGKAEISLKISISKNVVKTTITVFDFATVPSMVEFESSELSACISAVEQAALKLGRGEDMDRKVGKLNFSVAADSDRKRCLSISRIPLRSPSEIIAFDVDNITALSKLLHRVEENVLWLEPRTRFLLPGSVEPVAPTAPPVPSK